MLGVLAGFDLNTFQNPTVVHAFTLKIIGSASGISNVTFLQGVYDLGPDYATGPVAAYSSSIIGNGTLYTYPIQIPQQLLAGFVSPSHMTMLMTMDFSKAANYTTSKGDKPILMDVDIVRGIISDLRLESGSNITTYVTGMAAISQDMETSSTNDMALIEPITIIVILVLMGTCSGPSWGSSCPWGRSAWRSVSARRWYSCSARPS